MQNEMCTNAQNILSVLQVCAKGKGRGEVLCAEIERGNRNTEEERRREGGKVWCVWWWGRRSHASSFRLPPLFICYAKRQGKKEKCKKHSVAEESL